jgi:hypothetical protein
VLDGRCGDTGDIGEGGQVERERRRAVEFNRRGTSCLLLAKYEETI